MPLWEQTKPPKHQAKLPGIIVPGYRANQSDSFFFLFFFFHCQVQHASRYSPPGPAVHSRDIIPEDMSMTIQGSQRHRACMTYRVESFATVCRGRLGETWQCRTMLCLSDKVRLLGLGDGRIGPSHHACAVRPSCCICCCMLRATVQSCALPVSSPATQLCDRGDLGKPSVIDKDISHPMTDNVQSSSDGGPHRKRLAF